METILHNLDEQVIITQSLKECLNPFRTKLVELIDESKNQVIYFASNNMESRLVQYSELFENSLKVLFSTSKLSLELMIHAHEYIAVCRNIFQQQRFSGILAAQIIRIYNQKFGPSTYRISSSVYEDYIFFRLAKKVDNIKEARDSIESKLLIRDNSSLLRHLDSRIVAADEYYKEIQREIKFCRESIKEIELNGIFDSIFPPIHSFILLFVLFNKTDPTRNPAGHQQSLVGISFCYY